MNDNQVSAHSQQDVEEAIKALSDADWFRFEKAAQFQVFCYSQIEADDLLNETFIRVLDDIRHWTLGVPFTVFFYNAMRSIAHEWRKDEKERPDTLEVDLPSSPGW